MSTSSSVETEVGRAALQSDFSVGEIRYDCSLSQAGFVTYPVQLTGPSDQLTSWSELFPIEELQPATTKLAIPRGTESSKSISFHRRVRCEPVSARGRTRRRLLARR